MSEEDKIKKSYARNLKQQRDKVIDVLDKTDVDKYHLGKSDLDETLEDAIEDTAHEENWTEEKSGKIAPTFKNGSSEIDRDAVDERKSITHDDLIITRTSTLKGTLKQKTDSPSDDSEKSE